MALASVGTQLQVGDGASPVEAFTAISEVLTISGPELTSEDIEVTALDAPSGFKQFIAGLRDAGQVTFDLNFLLVNSLQNQLRDDQAAGTERNYRLRWPQVSPAVTATFAARVTGFNVASDPAAQIKSSVTLKISGVVTWSN